LDISRESVGKAIADTARVITKSRRLLKCMLAEELGFSDGFGGSQSG
jgi:hypothetical protein